MHREMHSQDIALVSGATGYVGANLAAELARRGWKVHALLRSTSRVPELLRHDHIVLQHHDGATGTLCELVQKTRPTMVYHLASRFIPIHTREDVKDIVNANLLFGTQILEACKDAGVKHFINTGSAWQFRHGAAYDPVNLYAASKEAFEAVSRYFVEAHGIVLLTLILPDTYGLGDWRKKLISQLKNAMDSGKVLSMSPGEQLIDLVHITDVTSGYIRAGELIRSLPQKSLERYSVSSGTHITLRQLVKEIENITGRPIPVEWGALPYRPREPLNSVTNVRLLPQWRPAMSLHQGLKQLFE
jgi:nucleoside-diphosphate-sugar epimerase